MPVNVIAGCRASGSAPTAVGGREHGEAVRAGGVGDELPGAQRAGLGQAGDQAGERVVGHGEQHQVGGGGDLVGGEQRDAGQQVLGAGLEAAETPDGGDHPVAGGARARRRARRRPGRRR